MAAATTALLLIDLQKAIDHPSWGIRNNPNAERIGAHILNYWRTTGQPVVHIRHDSREPGSQYRPGQPNHAFKPEFAPHPEEPVFGKQTGSAFVETGVEAYLRQLGVDTLVVFGVITNNSVETTVRHASCLGFRVLLVEDACFTFGRNDWAGVPRSAAEVHQLSLANLHSEYCQVVHSHSIVPGGL